MDVKLLAELRRRRNGTAQQHQQQQQQQQQQQHQQQTIRSRLGRQERAIGGATRSKLAAKSAAVAVVPPSRQNHINNNNKNSNKNNTSRIAFGRTCSGRRMGHATLPQALGQPKVRIDTPRPVTSKPRLAAAHEQLELLLTRIERGSDVSRTATPTSTAPRRRKPLPPRAVRRQMEHPPPVPTVTPLSSARNNNNNIKNSNNNNNNYYEQLLQGAATTAAEAANAEIAEQTTSPSANPSDTPFVPLTQNPQSLSPAKRRALLELLTRAERHDQAIVNILRSEVSDAGDPSRDAMRLTLQMLPLALKPEESPYCKRFWAGHRYLKERQKLHQQLQPDDLRYKEVKILRSPDGNFFLSKTLEDELKDEKHVLDFIESELQCNKQISMSPEQKARQDKALNERIELDRQKQQVSEWRARHHRCQELQKAEKHMTKKMLAKAKRLRQESKHLMQMQLLPAIQEDQLPDQDEDEEQEQQQQQQEQQEDEELQEQQQKDQQHNSDETDDDHDDDDDVTPRPTAAQAAMSEDYKDLLLQRQQFRQQCERSSFYSNPSCETPWKLFSSIATKLNAELSEKVDAELHRSIAGYLKDFVDQEERMAKQND